MGYSNYELDKCSRILKDNTAVEDIGHKPYTDSFIHQTSYGKVEEVFMDNVVSLDDELEFVGKQLFIFANYYFLPTPPTVNAISQIIQS
jgi:hypothetical protein